MGRKKGRKKSHRGGRSNLVGGARGPGYSQIVKVSGNVTWSVSTTGATFAGIQLSGPGSGTSFTPYSNGINYATLSQWGDFRLSKIVLTFIAQVGSAGDPLQVVSALDSTGNDLAGGSVTGAFNAILSRQSAKKSVVTPMQQKPIKHTWRPVEMQNRLWQPQSSLSSLSYVDAVQQWGVLFSAVSPASSTTISVYIDWFVEVREPTLSGVLIGKETPEARLRLEQLTTQSLPLKQEIPANSPQSSRDCVAPAAGVIYDHQMAATSGSSAEPTVGELSKEIAELTKLVHRIMQRM